MLFSVIIPIYNAERYMCQCIDSILQQSYRDFELILVNDGSTDNSKQLCDEYEQRDNRITVIHKNNGGATSARKEGGKCARGEYVIYVDGDDLIRKDTLQQVADIILNNSCDIVCFGSVTYPNKSKNGSLSLYREGMYNKEQIVKEIFPSLITSENGKRFPPSIWGKAFKKELILSVQSDLPDDIVIGEDSCVSYPCIYLSDNIFILHDDLYRYRIENQSITRQYKKAFSWEEPLRRAEFYMKYMPKAEFAEQIFRITSHSFFNVAISVLKTKKYRDAKKEILQWLSDKEVRKILKQTKFKNNIKEKTALFCLKHNAIFLMKILSKVI